MFVPRPESNPEKNLNQPCLFEWPEKKRWAKGGFINMTSYQKDIWESVIRATNDTTASLLHFNETFSTYQSSIERNDLSYWYASNTHTPTPNSYITFLRGPIA